MKDFNYSLIVENNIVFINLNGDLVDEFASEIELRDKINLEIEKTNFNCVIDLSGVKYISSNGIGWLIVLLTKLRNRGGELVLVKPSDQIKKLLLITKLNGIFDVFDSKGDAIFFLKNNIK